LESDEIVKKHVQLIQVAAEILTYYEKNRISLRNAMKKYSLFADIEDIQSYSQVHALVFETVRFQNISNRIIHQKIQNNFDNEISRNLRNRLRIITYLLTLAPETPQDSYWTASSKLMLASLDKEYSSQIFVDFFTFLQSWTLTTLLDDISDPEERIGVKYTHPTWIVRDFIKTFGRETTLKILEYNNRPFPVYLRMNLLNYDKNIIIEQLQEEGVLTETDPQIDDVLRVISSRKPLPRTPSFQKGLYYMQTKGSALISHILSPKKGERVLDACAAPGGKTTHIATLQEDLGLIIATDNNQRRMNELQKKILSFNLHSINPMLFDLRMGNPFKIFFDKILLDAPCSGSGTFSSRPDAKWRINRHQVKWLQNLQYHLLENVSKMLVKTPTSSLVYSTCSLFTMENEDVIEKFLVNNPDFELKEQNLFIGSPSTKFPLAQRLFPHINETEGFSIFKLGYK
jgi:16S rRNA (cytosine967-C5)-methyltransferase